MTLVDIISNGGLLCDGDWIEKKDQDVRGKVRLIQLADIGDGEFKDKSSKYITLETAERLHCTFLEKGDILIARLPEPLGRASPPANWHFLQAGCKGKCDFLR